MYSDTVIVTIFPCPLFENAVTLEWYVITGALRTAALVMTSPSMRCLVDSYSLYCARSAMLTRYIMGMYAQEPLDHIRRFHKTHMGVAWPLMQTVHPIMSMTPEKAYLAAALEFLPRDLTICIYEAMNVPHSNHS